MGSTDTYKERKQSLDSIYADQKQALDARQQALDEERRVVEEWYKRGLAMLNQARSEADSSDALSSGENEQATVTPLRQSTLGANGSNGSRPWGRRSMSEEARIIVDDIQDEIITQPLIRERFVEKHSGGDSPSLQSAISHLLRRLTENGELEFIGKGAATEPYRYRKTKEYRKTHTQEEVGPLGP